MHGSDSKPQWAQNKICVIDDGKIEEYNVGAFIEEHAHSDGRRLFYDRESAEAFLASADGVEYTQNCERESRQSRAAAQERGDAILVCDEHGDPHPVAV